MPADGGALGHHQAGDEPKVLEGDIAERGASEEHEGA
jgi:hypothetical protein